jgi:mono/diheme cytochrome c family protein
MFRTLLLSSRSTTSDGQGSPGHLIFISVSAAVLFLLAGTFALAQKPNSQPHPQNTSAGSVDRGKYIVDSVAVCGQCHTPRDANGGPDRAQSLKGAPVRWQPVKPDPNWPLTAPRIGGTPLPASDEDMIKLLTTGIWTTGAHLRAPMPQFRMDRSDAEAVVAYLKSLNSQQEP